jgi:hypothetical protein
VHGREDTLCFRLLVVVSSLYLTVTQCIGEKIDCRPLAKDKYSVYGALVQIFGEGPIIGR